MSGEKINEGLEYILEKVLPERKATELVNREKVLAKLEAEVERLRVELEKLESWQGIMELVNKIYPAHIFLDSDGDINEINWAEFSNVGVVVVNLIRRIDKLRAENPQTTELEAEIERLKIENARLSFIGYCECVDCTAVHLKGVNIGNRAENPQTTELENDYAKTRAAAVEKLLDGLGLPNAKSLAGLTEIELMAAAEKIAELEKENEKLRLAGVCDGCVG